MSDQAGPPSKQIQSVKQIQELLKDGDDAIIVGVFTSEGDAALEVYMEACKHSLCIKYFRSPYQVLFDLPALNDLLSPMFNMLQYYFYY